MNQYFKANILYHNGLFYDAYHTGKLAYSEDANEVQDIPFWLVMAKSYGDPILEMGCGTGRVAIPLAQQGLRVTGIDLIPSALELARAKCQTLSQKVSQRLQWIEADLRFLELKEKFPLIIFPYRGIEHFYDREDLERLFQCVRRHLLPGGIFIFNIGYLGNPSWHQLQRERTLDCIFPHPDGVGEIVVEVVEKLDWGRQIYTETLFFKIPGQTEEAIHEMQYRYFAPQEMEALIHYNGFAIAQKFGDYQQNPVTSESFHIIFVCQSETNN